MSTLLGVSFLAGDRLPPEVSGNGFGNDANAQPSSAFLIEAYAKQASAAAEEAIASDDFLARYAPCAADLLEQDEPACAAEFIARFGAQAYRRPLTDDEVAELLELQALVRVDGDFRSSLAAVIEAAVQTPDFLYRIELGADGESSPRRPSDFEMASRLSYMLLGGPPDEQLWAAAEAQQLGSADQVRAQAIRLLDSPRVRDVVRHFFQNYLPIGGLSDVARDTSLFPTFTPSIGTLMQEETLRFLEHQVFEEGGTWDSALTAPYTFVNEQLAAFYGIDGVSGDAFQKVALDTSKRLGLLTQGALLTGTTVTNITNPVRRGGFLLNHVLCSEVPLPPEELLAQVKPPEPYSGKTGRERYTAHSAQEACAGCHALLDPPGFALENFDAVGLWRDTEGGETIDASGSIPQLSQPFDGPVQLVEQIAASSETYKCFAKHWQQFAYGREVTAADKCASSQLTTAFANSGHDIKQLLVELTQTDAFLTLPDQEPLQ